MTRNTIMQGDCVESMKPMEGGSVDLVFADPPFNIGYDYDVCKDKMKFAEYLNWSFDWCHEAARILKPDGTIWLAIGDDWAAELKCLLSHRLGLHMRSWVIWHYTFGVNCRNKFTRSHTHLLYFTKDPKRFTFNADSVKFPSARQTKYKDKRAAFGGRLPDDTWEFPRICGTFRERVGWHGCQMPEKILERIIMACSMPGDLVFDPFLGSGTTAVVAKRLGRDWIGCELSEDYALQAKARIDAAC